MKILSGKELAGFIKERQAHQVKALSVQPHLLIIRDSDNPVIEKYVNLKIKYGDDIGVKVTDYLAKDTTDIERTIKQANEDPTIHGIILQLPLRTSPKPTVSPLLSRPQKTSTASLATLTHSTPPPPQPSTGS